MSYRTTTGVTVGSYTNSSLTVNTEGYVTSASSGSSNGGVTYTITVSDPSFDIPSSYTHFSAIFCGGGGSGGGMNTSGIAGGGGGSAATILLTLEPISTDTEINISIASGGSAVSDNADGNQGGNTVLTFNNTGRSWTAYGGGGGGGGSGSTDGRGGSTGGSSGAGSVSTGGDGTSGQFHVAKRAGLNGVAENIAGTSGVVAYGIFTGGTGGGGDTSGGEDGGTMFSKTGGLSPSLGGGGGASYFSNGGDGASASAHGVKPSYGAGGGGSSTTGFNSGAGGDGIVYLWFYKLTAG